MPPFHRPRRLEISFQNALDKLMRSWITLPKSAELESIIAYLSNGGGERFIAAAQGLARGMVTAVAVENAASWREAAAKSSQGARIYNLLRNEMAGPVGTKMRGLVAQHATLIRSIPQDLAQDVASQIATRQMRGERADVIARDISKRFPNIIKSRVATLARTQVSVTAESITRVRAERLGAGWYQWLSSEDSRVRPSHRKMDKVLCAYDDPPSPEALDGEKSVVKYAAGCIWNCRCTGVPIIDLDEVSWPAKVYAGSNITRMSRAKFRAISN
jgi:SPP1 gp7 family putative phage head morphogenesis protein